MCMDDHVDMSVVRCVYARIWVHEGVCVLPKAMNDASFRAWHGPPSSNVALIG